MKYRGRVYVDDMPLLSPAQHRLLRQRTGAAHRKLVRAATSLGSEGGRLYVVPPLPRANPRIEVTPRGVISATLGMVELFSSAELGWAAGHELVHLDQSEGPTPREADALAWAARHKVRGDAFQAIGQHHVWQREFEADRLAVERYGADPRAGISMLRRIVTIRHELGTRSDFEGPRPRLLSAHPPVADRCARLAQLADRGVTGCRSGVA